MMTIDRIKQILLCECASTQHECEPSDLSPLEGLYIRPGTRQVAPEEIEDILNNLSDAQIPPVWELPLALAAAHSNWRKFELLTHAIEKATLHWAEEAVESHDPSIRLAWAYALRSIGIAPRETESIASLYSTSSAASLCLPSGMVAGPPDSPVAPDLALTIRTGVLALLLGLRTESAGLLSIGRSAMSAVARLVTAKGIVWWPEALDAEHMLWALFGLIINSRFEKGIAAGAASRLMSRTGDTVFSDLEDISLFRLEMLWQNIPSHLDVPLDAPDSFPHYVSLPDLASGYCHGPGATHGWLWHGDRWPILGTSLTYGGCVLPSGPAWCHGDTQLWAMTSGRSLWNAPEEAWERHLEEGTLTWEGQVSIENRWLSCRGAATEHGAGLSFGRDLRIRGPLSWLTLFPDAGSSARLDRSTFHWCSHCGEKLMVKWSADSGAAQVRVLPSGLMSLTISEPMPKWIVIAEPDSAQSLVEYLSSPSA